MEFNYNELITFLSQKARIEMNSISKDSKIEDDLGISGDDAEELIMDFSKKFHVNITDFYLDKYFYSEHNLSYYSKNSKPSGFLTVNDLFKAVKLGRLDDSVINS